MQISRLLAMASVFAAFSGGPIVMPISAIQGNELAAVITTTKGDIHVTLFPVEAPLTVANFVNLAQRGYYDGLKFHRVLANFMIQGGGFDVDMIAKKTQSPIKNEADNGKKNIKGSISLARTSEIDSATSQFFINLSNNHFLDHGDRDYGYAVFGQVIKGLDVIDAILEVTTESRGSHQDVPKIPVIIEEISISD